MSEQNQNFISASNRITNAVIIGILSFVFSLGIITSGAAMAAGICSMRKVVRKNTGYPWRTFITSFKENFRPLFPFVLFFLLLTTFDLAGLYLVLHIDASVFSVFYMTFLFIILFLLICAQIHCYSLQGYLKLNKEELRSLTIRITFSFPARNLLLGCFFISSCIACFYIWPLLFFLPTLFLFSCTYIEDAMFHKFIRYDDDEEDEK